MNPNFKALIFDVDGTIADTEQYGHLPASNDAMEELGLDIKWTWAEFAAMIQTIPGTVNRLKAALIKKGYSTNEIADLATRFAPLKKSIYINRYLPNLKLRAGVENILMEAIKSNLQLAIVSTSYESQIKALLSYRLSRFYSFFNPILGKESGKKTENDGFLFKKCLETLQIQSTEAIVIEDSASGLKAAVCAGIPTAVFYNDYTYGSPFNHAKLVAPSMEYFSLKQLEQICLEPKMKEVSALEKAV